MNGVPVITCQSEFCIIHPRPRPGGGWTAPRPTRKPPRPRIPPRTTPRPRPRPRPRPPSPPSKAFFFFFFAEELSLLYFAGEKISTYWTRRDVEVILQRVLFRLIWQVDILSNSCETGLRWVWQNPTDDKSTLAQVTAWCPQATSHYLSHCWPRSMSPYDVTRSQWINHWHAELLSGNMKICLVLSH